MVEHQERANEGYHGAGVYGQRSEFEIDFSVHILDRIEVRVLYPIKVQLIIHVIVQIVT